MLIAAQRLLIALPLQTRVHCTDGVAAAPAARKKRVRVTDSDDSAGVL